MWVYPFSWAITDIMMLTLVQFYKLTIVGFSIVDELGKLLAYRFNRMETW